MVSISASAATVYFNRFFPDRSPAMFDARTFTLPDEVEAANLILWRQQDAIRNAISMAASHYFSHKELMGVSVEKRRELLAEKGIDVDSLDPRFLYGQVVHRVSSFEHVEYTDKRTGDKRRTEEPVERRRWQLDAAPQFDAKEGGWLLERLPITP